MTTRLSTLLALALLAACDEQGDEIQPGDPDYVRDPALDRDVVSAHGGTSSHNEGANCMQCHQQFGPGPGRFAVAGTVRDPDGAPLPDAAVELWTAPNGQGELVLRVEADARGNFFTTEDVDLTAAPAFPFVIAPGGDATNFMPFPTSSGACNVCHAGAAPVHVP